MRFIVTLVVLCVLIVTSSVMAEEPSDAEPPRTFAVWERPAAGFVLGTTGIGDPNSRDSSPEIGLVFDTPVVFGLRIRADASRTTWLFEARDAQRNLELRDSVTLKSARLSLLRVRHAGPRTTGYAGGGYGAYRYSYRASPLRNPWRAGLHGVAGLERTDPTRRYAFNGELRIHAINGTKQAPVASVVLLKIDAAIGVKLRF